MQIRHRVLAGLELVHNIHVFKAAIDRIHRLGEDAVAANVCWQFPVEGTWEESE
jgi:hypothetical protein